MDTIDLLDDNFGNEEKGIPIELTSVNRYILFDTLSFGLYSVWYMYYIWKFFKEKEHIDVMPIARAIFAIFFFYSMSEKILRFAQSKQYTKTYVSGLLFAGFIIFSLLTKLPDPYWLITIFSFIILIQPINAFNYAILNSAEYNGKMKTSFSPLQIVLMILGSIFWLLVIVGTLVPEPI